MIANGVTSELSLRKARLAVTQAELNYQDSVKGNIDLQKEAAAATVAGVECDRDVIAAREGVAQATQAVEDANRAAVQAQQAVIDANREVVKANQGVADAYENLADAQAALANSGAAAAGGLDKQAKAMAGLAPAAASFVLAMRALGGQFGALRRQVQQALFVGLDKEITALALTSLPTLRAGLTLIAAELNGVARATSQAIRSPIFQASLAAVFRQTSDAVRTLSSFLPNMVGLFVRLAELGGPLAQRFLAFATGLSAQALAFLQTNEGAALYTAFLEKAGDTAATLFGVLKNVGSIIVTVFAAGSIDGYLAKLQEVTGAFAAFLQTPEGQADLAVLFEALAKAAEAFAVVLPHVANAILAVFETIDRLPGGVQDAIFQFAALSLIAGPLITVLSGLTTLLPLVSGAFTLLLTPLKRAALGLAQFLVFTAGPALASAGASVAALAARAAAGFAAIAASAIAAAATTVASVARIVAAYVLVGAQALLAAAKVALSWVIAMGPIGIAIALVVGLVALVLANWDTIREATAAAWTAFSGFIGDAVDYVVGLFLNFTLVGLIIKHWDTIRTRTAETWAAVRSSVSEAWDAAVEAVRRGNERIVRFITDLPENFVRGLGVLRNLLFSQGQDLLLGLLDGMNSILKNIGRFMASQLPAALQDPFKRALGIASPSKVFRAYGQNIGQGLIEGIGSMTGGVAAAVTGLGSAATGNIALGNFNVNGVRGGPGGAAVGGASVVNNYTVQLPTVPFTAEQVGREAVSQLRYLEMAHL